MRAVITLLFILIRFSLLAQQQLILKTNPVYLLEFEKPAMPVGLEYTFGSFGIQLEQMILFSKQTNDGSLQHQSYNKTNVQLRYYFDGFVLKDLKLFVGFHGTRRIHNYRESFGSYVSAGGLDISHRGSMVEAKDFGVYYILGSRMAINSKLDLEVVTGFGFRELSIRHNPESFTFAYDLYHDFINESAREGTRTLPALLGQIRINYKIF